MAMFHTIKQLEEKNVAAEINVMIWSDRMDLGAFSNVKGEVSLHRLTWTKAWTLGPPKEGLIVRGMAWRPDGKILAIAYNSGEILLVSVENKSVLNTIDIGADVSCIYWLQEKLEPKTVDFHYLVDSNEAVDYMKYADFSPIFLSEPPRPSTTSASTSTETNQILNILQNHTELNLLLIGTTDGFVHINIFGCFPCASLDINTFIGCKCSIESIHLTEDLSKMFVTVKDADNNIKIVFIDSLVFKSHTKELFGTALKYIRLTNLVDYLSEAITTITETLESILLEMDTKLSKYATKVADCGVTADFLDLLMFGICSNEMEEFLVHDLTKKGLEKFGQTIELSYANIQKLLLKYVTKYGQNITYHLAELRGMARLEHRYHVVGLCEDQITEAIRSNGSFLVKVGEMQQIINHSIVNYKAFFRWLYTAIMHLLDEPVPSEIPKMTQQDLAYIAEFLQNFDHIGRKNDGLHTKFIMERLGQYLDANSLTIPSNMGGNDWSLFLAQNECVRNHPDLIEHHIDKSLVQQFNCLEQSVNGVFIEPKRSISRQFKVLHVLNCFNNTVADGTTTNTSCCLRSTHINLSKDLVLFALLQPAQRERVLLLQIQTNSNTILSRGKCANFYFSQYLTYDDDTSLSSSSHGSSNNNNYNVLDIKFYSNTILSVLLEENNSNSNNTKMPVLYQFPLAVALEKLDEIDIIINNDLTAGTAAIPNVNGSHFVPKLFKTIEGMIASQFAVSGSRRVSVVLSESRRKVRLFEMEGEDEDDEDAEMTNSTMKDMSDMNVQDESVVSC